MGPTTNIFSITKHLLRFSPHPVLSSLGERGRVRRVKMVKI
jgi:hypothetical protein